MSIYVDFHVLQTVPPSCVNRDDTGSPKTAEYGGATRARVSSQAWKHAMRGDFKNEFAEEDLGKRTKHVIKMVATEMLAIDNTLDVEKCNSTAKKALEKAGIKFSAKKPEEADALFFMSTKQAKAIAEYALGLESAEKDPKAILKNNHSVDIALFGRMVASDPTLNCDATAQVAHAISTHAIQNEYDYFTAVDDLQKEDNAGAGHLGTVEFNSSTLYRYANVNVSALAEIIGKDNIAEVIQKFAKAFICSMPTGKENTFANRTFPDAVYVTVRSDQPVNLCGAFENPVKNTNHTGYAVESEKKLKDYAQKVYDNFCAEPENAFCIGDTLSEIATFLPLPALLSELGNAVNAKLEV